MALVRRAEAAAGGSPVEVLDEAGEAVPVLGDFLAHLAARGCSPNTVLAYGYDLGHLWRFLGAARLRWEALTPERAVDLLLHLRTTPARRRGQPRTPVLATNEGTPTGPSGLSAATVNRALAAVSSFYDWTILAGRFDGRNPIARVADRALVHVTDRHRPFLAGISRPQATRRALHVKMVVRLPRPLDPNQVTALLGALRCRRDRALVHLMLDGGLRPGEALGLHLLGRIALHTGIRDPAQLRTEHVEALLAAVRRFGERADVAEFYASAARYRVSPSKPGSPTSTCLASCSTIVAKVTSVLVNTCRPTRSGRRRGRRWKPSWTAGLPCGG